LDDLAVSVIIPTRNRSRSVVRTVEAVWAQTFAGALELVLIDNASTDETPAVLSELVGKSPVPARLIRVQDDQGPANARNVGIRAAKGRILVFYDSDVIPNPQWIQTAVDHLASHPQIGILGGMLAYASRPDLCNIYGGELTPLCLAWDGFIAVPVSDVPEQFDCLWTPTAAVAVRREVFDTIGELDRTFYYSFEDADLGWRARLAGFECVCRSELVALHDSLPALRPAGKVIVFHQSKNRLRMMLKCYSLGNLVRYLPVLLPYSLAEAFLRPQPLSRFKALGWNLVHLLDTLRERKAVQAKRKLSDAQLAHLFTRNWLPQQTLKARRESEAEIVLGGKRG